MQIPKTFSRPTVITRINDDFNEHKNRPIPSVNPGIDYDCPVHTRVNSVADGVITKVAKSSLIGWYVWVDHTGEWAGTNADYMHLENDPRVSLGIKVGQSIKQGNQLAWSGATGSVVTGRHLHISVRVGGVHLGKVGNFDLELYIGTSTKEKEKLMEKLIKIVNDNGAKVKVGEFYYHRDGLSPIIGPLSGVPGKFGQVNWFSGVLDIPIEEVGGASFEAYRVEMAKLVPVSTEGGTPSPDLSELTGALSRLEALMGEGFTGTLVPKK